MANERSIADVLQDIVGDVQDIVRSEVRLAKAELGNELTKVKAAAPLMLVGVASGLLAGLFLAWTAFYALALVIPKWGAALCVAFVLGVVGIIAGTASLNLLIRVEPPERTIASVKENVQWAKQQVK